MLDFTIQDREILKELFQHGEVPLYNLHLKYRLAPAHIVLFLDKIQASEVVQCTTETMFLIERGRRWIVANRLRIFCGNRGEYWKSNSHFDARRGSFAPFIPKKKTVDQKFFASLLKKEET